MRSVFYLLCMAFTGYVMVMYNEPWCMELMVLEGIIFLACLILAARFRFAVEMDFSIKNNVVQKNDKIFVYLTMTNKSMLPVSKITVRVRATRGLNKQVKIYKAAGAVDGHSKTMIQLELEASGCGVIQLKADKVTVWDYLRIFHFRRRCQADASLIVIPDIFPASLSVISNFRYFTGEGDVFSDTEAGDDPSEVFEVRPYHVGDKMQKIHWKLSARTDDLFVKDYSDPVGFAIVVILDVSGQRISDEVYDSLMTAAFSICMQLIADGYTHYIAWQDKNGAWSRFRIVSENAVYKAMPYILKTLEDVREDKTGEVLPQNAAQDYTDKFGRASYHTMLRLDTQLIVYHNEEPVRNLDGANIRQSLLDMNMEI